MRDAAIQKENQSKSNATNVKTLLSFHMFKTAGRDLDRIIKRQFPKDAIFRSEAESPESIKETTDLLQRLSEKERQRFRLVYNGLFFGMHEYLPGPCTYVTLIHNPVKRVMSEYYHILRTPDHPVHSEVVSKKMSLEDYIRNGMWLAWNYQVRHIRGAPGGWFERGPVHVSTDDLEIAKKNLRDHFTFGLTERFVESLILFKRAFEWRMLSILYVRQPRGPNLPPLNSVSSKTIKLIEKHNELDIQLYEFAKQIFEERISQQGSSFRREVQSFQFYNKIYSSARSGAGILLRKTKLLKPTPQS